MKNVAVLVSGGVDSSVALRLLKDQGYNLTAFYLKIWLEDELASLGSCPWEEDLAYVRAVCEQADVPLKIVSLQDEYWKEVVQYALHEIKQGRTPNPDMLCNKRIKFGAFYEYVGKHFDYIATGHYAQIEHGLQEVRLTRSPDAIKDQTYFLAQLSKDQLRKALFPVGHLTKAQVRELAHAYDLPNKDRKDSQGICFLGKIKFSDFIKHHFGERPGNLVEVETGDVVGKHPGFYYYTLGQRQGLGLAGGPWYVVKKDPMANIVYISRHYFTDDKIRNSFTVAECNWFAELMPSHDMMVKLRHGPQLYKAHITRQVDETLQVSIDEHDQGIAPGQFAVFYHNEVCVGSGVIQ